MVSFYADFIEALIAGDHLARGIVLLVLPVRTPHETTSTAGANQCKSMSRWYLEDGFKVGRVICSNAGRCRLRYC
jgi:myo-inositol catabolism protein IolC